MEAAIDGYAQMRVMLSKTDIASLGEQGRIEDAIWRYGEEIAHHKSPFFVYLRSQGRVKAFSLPRRESWENKTAYVLRLTEEAMDAIKQEKFVGLGPIATSLRSVSVSLDGVY